MASAKTVANGGGFVSSDTIIPPNARKAVEELREVLRSSSQEEIYAMLRECNMDPNEAVQRLITQDTFHEVRRKRDRRKENASKDSGDGRMRPPGNSLLFRGGRMVDGRTGNVAYQRSRVSNIAIAITPLSSQSHAKPGSIGASVTVSASVTSGSPVSKSGVSPSSESFHSSGSTYPRVISIDSKASSASEQTVTDLHAVSQSTASHNSKEVNLIRSQKSVADQGAPLPVNAAGKLCQSPQHRLSMSQEHATIVSLDVGNLVEPETRSSSEVTRTGVVRTGTVSSHYNSKVMYQSQQQPSGTHKEWKPKLPATNSFSNEAASEKLSISEAVRLSSPASPSDTHALIPYTDSSLERLSLQDSQLVVIPHYLQVQDVDLSYLRFGSFTAGLVNTFNTSLGSEDNVKCSSTAEAYTQADDVPNEEQIEDSSENAKFSGYNQHFTCNDEETSNSSKIATDFPSSDSSASVTTVTSEPEVSKPDPVIQQTTQHPYVAAGSGYSGFAVPSQTVGVRYSYNSAESQLQEVSRLRSFVQQPYPDSANFYNPNIRGNPDGEAPYGQLISTNSSSKFNSGIGFLSGQSLSSSQEGVNSLAHSATSLTGQLSQSAGIGQMTLTMPQQHLAIHPYPGQPAGLPVSPFATNVFGYQFVPPSFAYMQTLYQNYAGNTGYTQLPASSNYAPAAGGNTYSPAGGAMVKYPLPQYKTVIAAGSTPHAAIAAGYGSSAPVFAVNPAVSTGNVSGYDDVTAPQYKVDGSGVWIQAHSSRDMAGLQTNSYYNITGQGQHAGYIHTQATNAHPAVNYASLYQLPQSNPGAHQLLQQPQALGAIGAVATSYQQGRGQVNWASNY